MTLALAQTSANSLREALLDNGVRRVSIELQQGVSSSGWHVNTFKRGLGHHIVSRPSAGPTPGLALVKRGRPDLGGPLCNGYGGFDLTARIITMGWANHPGLGGPWSVPGWGTVPKDNGRPYIFGWEFEGGLEPYTDEMHDFMARCGAGTLDWLGNAPLECWNEHSGWAPGRKIDRLGYTAASGRARIAAVRGTNTEEIDVAAEQNILNAIQGLKNDLASVEGVPLDYRGHHGNPKDNQFGQTLGIRKDVEAFRLEVIARLTALEARAGGMPAADIKELVEQVIRENVVKVDVDITPGA